MTSQKRFGARALGYGEGSGSRHVAAIHIKLADASLRKGVAAPDFAALGAFYAEPSGGMDHRHRVLGQGAGCHQEIGKADDWGLSTAAFELPPAGDLPPALG